MENKSTGLLILVFFILFSAVIYQAKAETPLPPLAQQDIGLLRQDKIEKAKGLYSEAEKFMQKEDYFAADDALKKAQQLLEEIPAPKSGQAEPAEAVLVETLQPAAKNKPGPPAAAAAKTPAAQAWELSQNEQSKDAIPYYLKALELDPKNTSLLFNLAVEYIKTAQPELAVKAFKQIIALNPRDKDAYYNLGVLYDNYLNDKKQALDYYRKYIKFAPADEDTRQVKKWIEDICKFSGGE